MSFFIEQNVDASIEQSQRPLVDGLPGLDNSGSAVLPETMASSGHQVADGSVGFPGATTGQYYNAYKSMVGCGIGPVACGRSRCFRRARRK